MTTLNRVQDGVILDAEHAIVKTSLDDFGHFAIDGLTPGAHRLEVRLPDALSR